MALPMLILPFGHYRPLSFSMDMIHGESLNWGKVCPLLDSSFFLSSVTRKLISGQVVEESINSLVGEQRSMFPSIEEDF